MMSWVLIYMSIAMVSWPLLIRLAMNREAADELDELNSIYGRHGYRLDRESWIEREIERRGGRLLSTERIYNIVGTRAVWAISWPVTLIGFALMAYLSLTTNGLTSKVELQVERTAAERRELEALRRLAREHGLALPGDPR